MSKKPEEIIWLLYILSDKKTIIGVIICLVLTFLVTRPVFIKPLYESETIVYVPLTSLNQQLSQQGIGFANEREVEQYIQILKSTSMADSLMNKFGLKGNQKKSKVYETLESRIKVEKTRYSSVSIKVRDNDPERAATMANYMVHLVEIIKQNLFYPNRLDAMLYSKGLFEQKASEMTKIENRLDSIEKHGTPLTLKNSWLYIKLTNTYKIELQELIGRKNEYEHIQKEFDSTLPKAYVIATGVAADKPVWPKPWLLCILAVTGYLIIILFIAIIKRDFRKEEL